jgi:hypothetical protein
MTKLEDIEKAVEQLSQDELARFRAWFDELQARRFDDRLERDIEEGKLDWLAEEALNEHKRSQGCKLPQ